MPLCQVLRIGKSSGSVPACGRMGLPADDAYMFSSLAVDMRVTQLVDGNKGIHAMLPKRYVPG